MGLIMTGYQKLKKKNRELHEELRELALKPHSLKSQKIIAKIKFSDRLEKQAWYGESCSKNDGILNQIT